MNINPYLPLNHQDIDDLPPIEEEDNDDNN